MTLLDSIKQMKNQGISEQEIYSQLKFQGYSPLQINQALEQSKIRSAVYEPEQEIPFAEQQEDANQYPQFQNQETNMQNQQNEQLAQEVDAGMSPSMMQNQEQYPQQDTNQYPQFQNQDYQAYSQEYGQSQTYAPSSDTFTEIAEQVSDEKLKKLKKDMAEISIFKDIADRKIETIDKRLKKIEEIIDSLYQKILGRIGSYGDSVEEIKKEMSMMQESFSKALPEIIKHPHKTQSQSHKSEKKDSKSHKKSSGIEHYIRR